MNVALQFTMVVSFLVVLLLICLCILRSLTRLEGLEGKLKTTEWSIDEVYEKITENYKEEVAKRFKGEFNTRLEFTLQLNSKAKENTRNSP